MRYRVVRAIAVCSVILLLSSTAVRAQSVSTAQIDGTVQNGGGWAIQAGSGAPGIPNIPGQRQAADSV